MALIKYQPFGLMRDLDRFFDDRFLESWEGTHGWAPRMDIVDREDSLLVRVEVPGMNADAVDVTVENDVLSISGRRTLTSEETEGTAIRKEIIEGEFCRTIRLPKGIDRENVAANYHDGMLEVVIPKTAEVQPKRIAIDVKS